MTTRRRKIAIVGAAGQLGTDLVTAFSASPGWEPTPLGREQIDVRDPDSVDRLLGRGDYDAVVNAAAMTNVDLCEEQGEEALAINGRGAYLVARACAAAGSACVYISTDFIFDGYEGAPYDEHDPANPVNIYGASKLAGEAMTRAAAADALVVRISSVFGRAGARGKGGNFIETILRQARAGKSLRVIDDIRMSPSYTVDVAQALVPLLDSGATGVVHLANGGSCSWFEFATSALETCDLDIPVEPVPGATYPMKARRPRDSSLRGERAAALLGRPMRPWQEALRAYLREKGHLPEDTRLPEEAS